VCGFGNRRGGTVSARAFGAEMPAHVTLDDVASMAAADENHRYELSPEGALSITPPADPEHALLVMRMILWLASHGYEAEQLAADCGIDVGGGRVPDLPVWAKGMPQRRARSSYAGTSGLLLAVEVVSSGSEVIDRIIKKAEYAKVGIPRYWVVQRLFRYGAAAPSSAPVAECPATGCRLAAALWPMLLGCSDDGCTQCPIVFTRPCHHEDQTARSGLCERSSSP
jgi:Uma2 family endonuclease